MSSNIEIIKKCKWCGKEFVARKTTTEWKTQARMTP